MNNKSFFKHFFSIGIGTFLNLLIGVITTPIITRMVNPTQYGQLSIFTIYSNIAVMTLCLGLDQALIRYYYQSSDLKYKKKLLFLCVVFPVIFCMFSSILCILNNIYNVIPSDFDLYITILLCIYTLIQILYRFSMAITRLDYNSKLYSKLQVMLKIIYVILAILLITIFKENHLLLLCIATVASALICLIVSFNSQKEIWKFNKEEMINIKINFKELIKYSYPFIFSMSIAVLFQAIDKLSLNFFCDYSTVGIYSSALSLIHIFSIIQTTFNTLWVPMAIQHYTENPEDKTFYQKGNRIITIIMFFIGINLIIFKDILALLLGEDYREATYVFPFLIFNPIMYTISETTVNGLVFKKKSNYQVLISVISCGANLIGNFLLIPILGSKGAAISTGISYIIFFSLRTLFSNKFFYIDFGLKKIYLLTFVVSVYALYNTYFKTNILSVIGYFFCLLTIVFLYKDDIKYYSQKVYEKIIYKMKEGENK